MWGVKQEHGVQVWGHEEGAGGEWGAAGSWEDGQGIGLKGTEEAFILAEEVCTPTPLAFRTILGYFVRQGLQRQRGTPCLPHFRLLVAAALRAAAQGTVANSMHVDLNRELVSVQKQVAREAEPSATSDEDAPANPSGETAAEAQMDELKADDVAESSKSSNNRLAGLILGCITAAVTACAAVVAAVIFLRRCHAPLLTVLCSGSPHSMRGFAAGAAGGGLDMLVPCIFVTTEKVTQRKRP